MAEDPIHSRVQQFPFYKVYIHGTTSRIESFRANWMICTGWTMTSGNMEDMRRVAYGIRVTCDSLDTSELFQLARTLLTSLISTGLDTPRRHQASLGAENVSADEFTSSPISRPSVSGTLPNEKNLSSDREKNDYILLVDSDRQLTEEISLQLRHFEYHTHAIHRTDDLTSALSTKMPSAIILDTVFPHSRLGGIEAIEALKKNDIPLPAVLFLSSRSDIEARLHAVRVGGNAYLTKPVNIADLVDQLDILTNKGADMPYRIMMVDDDIHLSRLHSKILRDAGMETKIVSDPFMLIEEFSEFNPELIMMDIFMPDCDGIELAKVIRQIESYISVPIVFLSSILNADEQLDAMSGGADDFLTKPIKPEHLVSAVQTRAARYRKLRSMMVRDSLTGLYNHTRTKEMLEAEVARAARSNANLVFAMLDIDEFKTINDKFGHLTGDYVIKNLARLLKQRLRKIDIVGRPGGEEFALILPDTSLYRAEILVNEIRENFSHITQHTSNGEFLCTFSCGIAAFPEFVDDKSLYEAADLALYAAKEGGKNQVRLAGKD